MGSRNRRVKSDFEGGSAEPIFGVAGERLSWERRPTDHPGWVWCTNQAGRSGWVPEGWLELHEGQCELRRDYDGTELTVKAGQMVWVELEESGWALVTRHGGGRGWVPLKHLET